MEQALEAKARAVTRPVVVSFPLSVPLAPSRQFIEEGKIGHPEHVLATNYVNYGTIYFDCHYRDYQVTQGLIVQKGTHDLDALMYLMGSSIVRVATIATRGRVFGGNKPAGLVCSKCDEADRCLESPKNRTRNVSGGVLWDHPCVFGSDIGTPQTGMNEDSSSVLFEFASGVHGVYTQVFYSRRDASRRGAIISGYGGTLDFDWYRNDIRYVRHHQPFSDTVSAPVGASHFGGDMELAHDFISLVKGTGKSRTPMWTGLQSVYACLAASESADRGSFVKVRQVAEELREREGAGSPSPAAPRGARPAHEGLASGRTQ
jgi:predicted dehydrogenase